MGFMVDEFVSIYLISFELNWIEERDESTRKKKKKLQENEWYMSSTFSYTFIQFFELLHGMSIFEQNDFLSECFYDLTTFVVFRLNW